VGTGTRYYVDMVENEVKKGKSMKEIIEQFAHSEGRIEEADDLDALLNY